MFKLFNIRFDNKYEVKPIDGIYIVYELHEYEFEYTGKADKVFIEDLVLDYNNSLLIETKTGIKTKYKKRLFEDYFGYLKIRFDLNEFKFEVRIQKLKVPELEQILLYIWNNNPIIFDNFLSKSTIKSKLVKEQQNNFKFSSKFVNIFEDFFTFFNQNYFIFKNLPYSVLREKNKIVNFEEASVSDNSIDWLLNNLDELQLDYRFKNATNAIKIQNNYAIVEKILTQEKRPYYNVYENQIILGNFDYIIHEISKIKEKIKTHVSVNQYYEKDFYSIDEFRIIPFLKIKEDLNTIESKIKFLKNKYQSIFIDSKSKNAFPKLTPVFSNKKHYTSAFNKIKLIRNININLEGELNLLNIKRISNLYEKYNLYVILNSLIDSKPKTLSSKQMSDESNQEFNFTFNTFSISLYYDYNVTNRENKTGLERISKGYYKPDYILKKESNKNEVNYYILDSKYSSEKPLKNRHLNDCIKKYILDLGVSKSNSVKVDDLILLYPGENKQIIYGNSYFKPQISILPSKTNLDYLKKFIKNITKDDGN